MAVAIVPACLQQQRQQQRQQQQQQRRQQQSRQSQTIYELALALTPALERAASSTDTDTALSEEAADADDGDDDAANVASCPSPSLRCGINVEVAQVQTWVSLRASDDTKWQQAADDDADDADDDDDEDDDEDDAVGGCPQAKEDADGNASDNPAQVQTRLHDAP
ncbi:myb-like protein AA [Drosophila montana]|uniref:myb-like protein AA n=1 Tax=Drosophila montana TaxID=40370 RepID=UPI00313C7265